MTIKGIINGRPAGNEQGIVTAILGYLAAIGAMPVHHRNSGAIVRSGGRIIFGRSRSMFNQRGAPDILFTYMGRGVAVEAKSATGRLRPEQREWLDRFQKGPSRGLVIVARSVDDVEKAVDKIKAGETWTADVGPA